MPEPTRRPLFITISLGIALLATVVCTMLTIMPVVGIEGEYTINQQVVSRAEFLRRAVPFFAPAAVLFAALSWGLWRPRSWVRPLSVGAWLIYGLVTAVFADDRADAVFGLVVGLVMAGLVAWYLYGNKRAAAYLTNAVQSPAWRDDDSAGAAT